MSKLLPLKILAIRGKYYYKLIDPLNCIVLPLSIILSFSWLDINQQLKNSSHISHANMMVVLANLFIYLLNKTKRRVIIIFLSTLKQFTLNLTLLKHMARLI